MHLVSFTTGRQPRAGVLAGGDIVDLAADPSLPTTPRGILAAGMLDAVRAVRDAKPARHLVPRKAARLLAPITDPAIVLSVGMNYHEHLKEMKTPVPDRPAAFTKSVASIIASGDPILLPPSNPNMVDWEGELTVVIGRPCHRVKAAQALDYVAGYTIVNDVSARDWVASVFSSTAIMQSIHAWEQNLLGKMLPTFCPLGPAIATRDEVPDPGDVRIVTRLNGAVMQDAHTNDLVFSVPKLIEYYSQFYRFLPGDCITTGSPSGVGYGRNPKVFMKDGDVIEVEVTGVGVLSNPVKAG